MADSELYYKGYCSKNSKCVPGKAICDLCFKKKETAPEIKIDKLDLHYRTVHMNKPLFTCSEKDCKQKFVSKAEKGIHEYYCHLKKTGWWTD